jgi:hypothetical protein
LILLMVSHLLGLLKELRVALNPADK